MTPQKTVPVSAINVVAVVVAFAFSLQPSYRQVVVVIVFVVVVNIVVVFIIFSPLLSLSCCCFICVYVSQPCYLCFMLVVVVNLYGASYRSLFG